MRDHREDKIQSLLRHAFSCTHNNASNCSCAKNIHDFLKSDKKSIEWADNIRNRMKEKV